MYQYHCLNIPSFFSSCIPAPKHLPQKSIFYSGILKTIQIYHPHIPITSQTGPFLPELLAPNSIQQSRPSGGRAHSRRAWQRSSINRKGPPGEEPRSKAFSLVSPASQAHSSEWVAGLAKEIESHNLHMIHLSIYRKACNS